MTIHLLGTAAAEGIPALGCNCEVCRTARERGGKNIRSRSGALIDNLLKIDFGPDTLYHIHRERLNPTDWRFLVFTHSHHDHCASEELQYLLPGFAPPETARNLRILGNAAVKAKVESVVAYTGLRLECMPIRAFERYTLGDYTLIPIRATHMTEVPDEEVLNLVVEREGRRLLYACDTGWYPNETWDFLAELELDLLVLECSFGFQPSNYSGHLDFEGCVEAVARMHKQGTLRPDSRVVLTHFSHNGGALHEALEARAAPYGILIGWDGMQLTL
ncbi:MAG: MBL fold metallo-hydrolase [Fimbriimonadales bacterium]|nr:MBL fold metallo-hydrolase [Fimbriimonadales bacterium]